MLAYATFTSFRRLGPALGSRTSTGGSSCATAIAPSLSNAVSRHSEYELDDLSPLSPRLEPPPLLARHPESI